MIIRNSIPWLDTGGVPINAHGGGILYHGGTYYWYGEFKREGWNGRLAWDGTSCYSSEDLRTWKNEGICLAVSDDPDSPIRKGCRIERPKVIFNKKTGKFVMWFHSTDENHTLGKAGTAIADSPAGPFRFIDAVWPDRGVWPLNVRDSDKDPVSIEAARAIGEENFGNGENDLVRKHNILGRDFDRGYHSRDMQLFTDDDGTAYHIHSSEHNSTLHICRLTDDYLCHSGEYIRIFENRWHEAPALFKREGRYYLLTSGCTSWDPNPARGSYADQILGEWTEFPNPARGINPDNGQGPETTWGSQSTFVLKIPGEDKYVAMFDLWNTKSFIESTYIWLPVRFEQDGTFSITWQNEIPV